MLRRPLVLIACLGILLGGLSVALSRPAQAQVNLGLNEVGQVIKLPSTDPRVIAAKIINISLGFLAIIFVSLLVYAGFLYMTSGGDPTKVSHAQKLILSAIVGLIIILSAWGIATFVIKKLLQAAGGGGGGGQQQQGGGGLGGGGGGGQNSFQVVSKSPQGDVKIKNVQVKMLFSKPVDEKTVTAITVSKEGGVGVAGTFVVSGSLVTFTPAAACPPPNELLKCFEGNTNYNVVIGGQVKSNQGQALVCGGFAQSCTFGFHTGDLIDIQAPTVYITDPLNGQGVSADSLIPVKAHAEDDSGVSYLEFYDNGKMIGQDGPKASSTPLTFDGQIQWDTSGLAVKSLHDLTVKAFDINDHNTLSAVVTTVIYPAWCFNGVKDGDEIDIDCGGSCGKCAGDSCKQDSECASKMCKNGQCVDQPIITSVTPGDGKPGTFVTMSGLNFGNFGKVTFLGGPTPQDDVDASFPAACLAAGLQSWSKTQVIIAVPDTAKSGPIRLTNGQSQLFDTTKDLPGQLILDFVVNDKTYPGLCGLFLNQGFVGDQFKAIGQGFGDKPDSLSFEGVKITSFAGWLDTLITTNVPVIGNGKHPVKVNVSGTSTNPVDFWVLAKSQGGPPTILSITPDKGPKQEYLTINGKNFGTSIGKVWFKNKGAQSGKEALGATSFPAQCSNSFWNETSIIIKVPSLFSDNVTPVVPDDYDVRVVRADTAESNQVNFPVVDGNAKPGICGISPSLGPIDTPVKIIGEGFGGDTGNATFYIKQDAIIGPGSWTNGEIGTTVPKGSITGPAKIMTLAKLESNPFNFEVKNCNETPGSCKKGDQCCPNGTCISDQVQCQVQKSLSSMFAWHSSTGIIPVAPQVVEECTPDKPQPPVPSPSPWDQRVGGDQVCIDASLKIRFTTKLDWGTVSKATFHVKQCTSDKGDVCSKTTDVIPKNGFPLPAPANVTQDYITIEAPDFQTNTTYLVEVTTGVKGAGIGGAFMTEKQGCGKGIAYCFRFKTRNSNEKCKLGAVGVTPHPYEMNQTGQEATYVANPLAAEDKCVALKCSTYDWEWTHGPNDSDPRALFKQPFKKDPDTGKNACIQTGIGMLETGNVPVHMNAKALPDNVLGTGDLYVKFLPPKVENYFPNCSKACINARIWVKFTSEILESSLANNVEVRACKNENCFELGDPLPIPPSHFKLKTVPQTSELTLRFLEIEPTTDGNPKQLLMVPGTYYRVLLRGGPKGIFGKNGVPLTGLNHPQGFVWIFRTNVGEEAMCKPESVSVAPGQKYEKEIGARQMFYASEYSAPDECSATGEPLVQLSSASWTSSETLVADYLPKNLIDTGGLLPAQCSNSCFALGSQGLNGKIAVCGNGIIETTDQKYCKTKTPFGDDCSLLPDGAKAGEQCDPGVLADKGWCNPATCLWLPVQQVPKGTCGNGSLNFGEMCDFGRQCMGAAPTSTTPNGTDCTSDTDKNECLKNGGSCAPPQYRGCSPFCQHTGAASGKSTCGNGDIADGEDCDDGNLSSNDACNADCLHTGSSKDVVSVCGNAILESGETCEKMNLADPTFPALCDATTCLHQGTSLCSNDPKDPKMQCCGNATIDTGEDCDDGNYQPGDGCNTSCLLEGSSAKYYPTPSFCGDGVLERGEQCEAGLLSSAKVLWKGVNNAAPSNLPIVGTGKGDGLIDMTQLAEIIGKGILDKDNKMSSTLTANIDSLDGHAVYGLQCGYTQESACPNSDVNGLTDGGCCSVRPKIQTHYPDGKGVCRNTQINVTFNTAMNVQSAKANVQISKQVQGDCPAGTTKVAEDGRPVKTGVWGWLTHAWRRVVAWATGGVVYAADPVWCAGSVKGSLSPATPTSTKDFVFELDNVLEANTLYRVRFLGDNSAADPLSDNDQLDKKQGIKSIEGVVTPFDPNDVGTLSWQFETSGNICALNVIQVKDQTDTGHPNLFKKPQEQHPFEAQAVSIENGIVKLVQSIPEYSWTWKPWASSNPASILIASSDANDSVVEAKNKNGSAFVVAQLKITNDEISVPSTTGAVLEGTVPVNVFLCENPWPHLDTPHKAPFRDVSVGDDPDSSLLGEIFEAGPYFNFSTMYCRDNATSSTQDDLPGLTINYVPVGATDKNEGVLRQYLFSYGDEYPGLKKDGIGIRVVTNPLHYSPLDWFAWHNFGGKPEQIVIDGYPALKTDGTVYVAAVNTQGQGTNMYSNMYVISRNPDASDQTKNIFDQMVQTLTFNINLKKGVANVCEIGNDPADETEFFQSSVLAELVSCKTDIECLTTAPNTHCSNYKLRLSRDSVRLADFQTMSRDIEKTHESNGFYPKLSGGTFVPGLSTSRWPSWTEEVKQEVKIQPPQDPINAFLSCGRCSSSKTMCSGDADCLSGQTCLGITPGLCSLSKTSCVLNNECSGEETCVGGALGSPTSTFDPATCWNALEHRYICPRIGAMPSRIYQYRALNIGQRYELGAEFEIPKPTDPNAGWWQPELIKEIFRCANTSTYGFLCSDDVDCRTCANPTDLVACPLQKYPKINGACKAVGGRFLYQNMCENKEYGQSGTCGDGVIGPGELCEIGQTSVADCTTPDNKDGIKVQVCSECKEFVDDAGLSTCNVGVQCGNGKVDNVCLGGPRAGKACLVNVDCQQNGQGGVCVASTEICDDGLLNGTYGHCNKSCSGYAAYCGDNMLSPGETCDNGPVDNGAYCGYQCDVSASCSLDCKEKAPHCGDGAVTSPEMCDGDTVTSVLAICLSGDNKDQPCSTDVECGANGKCAKGSQGPLDSCEGVTANRCATALKQCSKQKQGTINGAGYNPQDHVVCKTDDDCIGDPQGEFNCRSLTDLIDKCSSDTQCSYPGIPGTCTAYPTAHVHTCAAPGSAKQCSFADWTSCKVLNFCGDGVIDKPGEECDNGSDNGDTKACTASCKKNVCGDGKPLINVEECDAGSDNGKVTCKADYNMSCSSCSPECKFLASSGGYCGDKLKNGPEQCDGNSLSGSFQNKQVSCPGVGKPSLLCPYIQADCMQQPCQTSNEKGISCQSLGFDFALNGLQPKMESTSSTLNQLVSGNNCPELNGMKKFEMKMYQECLGLYCQKTCPLQKKAGEPCNDIIYKPTYNKVSANDFWQCVKEKGPANSVSIKTSGISGIMCSPSCSFSGCGKCSDESGTSYIDGQLVDAVYNEPVPFAKVSLFYKGTLVKQVASDENGRFLIEGMNDRQECSKYKLVIDKYDDNPCTNISNATDNGNKSPKCNWPESPLWTLKKSIDEGARGGYWSLTITDFGIQNFGTKSNKDPNGRILMFPRPGTGEAYFTVIWSKDWYTGSPGAIWGGNSNHLILPKVYAYTAPNGDEMKDQAFPDNFKPTTCNWDDRPSAEHQCVRDVTWSTSLKGHDDFSKFPHAQQYCLHSAGEKTQGYDDDDKNGCPVEGSDACIKAGKTATECKVFEPKCAVPKWNTCDFYSKGPITTYFRYNSFSQSDEPLHLLWNYWGQGAFITNSSDIKKRLQDQGYRAVISTDEQLLTVDSAQVSQTCGLACKFWHIGDVNPKDGLISVQNALLKGRQEVTEAVASYEYAFQGIQFKKYCRVGSDKLLKQCANDDGPNDNAACNAAGGQCLPMSYDENDPKSDYKLWSQYNY